MLSDKLAQNDDRFNDDYRFEFMNSESIQLKLRKYNAHRDGHIGINVLDAAFACVPFKFFSKQEEIYPTDDDVVVELFAVISLPDGSCEDVPFFECLFDVKLQLMKTNEDGSEESIINELSINDVHFYAGHITPVKLHIGHESMIFDPLNKLNFSDGVNAIVTVSVKEKKGVVARIVNSFSSPSKLTDLKITVGDTVFYVNKSIIAMSSPVLCSLIYPNPLEVVNELTIDDVATREFELLLKCIYPENTEINKNDAISIINLARKFKIDTVMWKCAEALKRFHIDCSNDDDDDEFIESTVNVCDRCDLSFLFDAVFDLRKASIRDVLTSNKFSNASPRIKHALDMLRKMVPRFEYEDDEYYFDYDSNVRFEDINPYDGDDYFGYSP